MAGPLRDAFREARSIVADLAGSTATSAASSRAPARATRAEIEAALIAFVREYIRSDAWTIIVPGEHTGGLSHQELLRVLASQGRDFLQSTVQLYQAVAIALRREFLGGGVVPTTEAMKRASETPLLDHVEMRFSKRGNADISVTTLTPKYAARKRALGRGTQPIGVASGELRRAYSRTAKVKWKR